MHLVGFMGAKIKKKFEIVTFPITRCVGYAFYECEVFMTSRLPVMRACLSFILIVMTVVTSVASSVPADSVSVEPLPRPAATWAPVLGGSLLLGSGAIARAGMGHYNGNFTSDGLASKGGGTPVADVVQYMPLALPWVAKLAGAETRSGWGRMAVSQGIGASLMMATTWSLKHTVDARRPDGSDNRSFPSGHTAWAFFGATVAAHELGHLSPWYTVGAYGVATGVGISRAIDNRHFPADVVAGAGIGIISAQLGYFIGDVIFKNRQLNERATYISRENNNLSALSLSCGMAVPMGHISIADGAIIRKPSLSAAIHGSFALDDNWGVSTEVTLLSTPILIEQHLTTTAVGNLNSIGAIVNGYYRQPLSSIIDISASAGVGYYFNLNMKSVGDAVTSGGGTPVGRVNFGAGLRLSDNFRCQASVGYQLSGYHFDVKESAVGADPYPNENPYNITRSDSRSGVTGSLLLGISTAVTF